MRSWLLSLWLCSHPGGVGECRPAETDLVFPTRPACLRAARGLEALEPRISTFCHLRRGDPAEPRDAGPR